MKWIPKPKTKDKIENIIGILGKRNFFLEIPLYALHELFHSLLFKFHDVYVMKTCKLSTSKQTI